MGNHEIMQMCLPTIKIYMVINQKVSDEEGGLQLTGQLQHALQMVHMVAWILCFMGLAVILGPI